MKKGLLILFVICAVAVAIPRNRRALPSEQVPTNGHTICDPSTPCAWKIYNPFNKQTETHIKNHYCICDEATECQIYEDDQPVSSYILRCMKPGTGLTFEHS